MPTRREMWERLHGDFDVLIIGGGINGAGIARDAARRGLKVALVEMKDLAYGTSSRSSKLVHGGLRYLEQLEFSLVFESVSERRILLDIAPHLVNPLAFLFPVYKGARHNLFMINAGMWLYEGLSLFRSPKRPKKLSRADIKEQEPALNTKGLKGAPLYYDCSTDDARLTLESALDATRAGAVIATWGRVSDFILEDGRIVGVEVVDEFTKEKKTVRAHTVINATGPWTNKTMDLSPENKATSLLRPTKGVHLVIEHKKLPVKHAVVCFHPEDGRVLFAIPWGDRTYLGTTDTDDEEDPSTVRATLSDVDYLIGAANEYFPQHKLSRDDVISTWAGLRPLIGKAKGKNDDVSESSVSREHQIIIGRDGLITIAGGKLTTYRRMSKEVVDTAVKLLRLSNKLPRKLMDARTDQEPLPGAVGWPEDDDHSRVAAQAKEIAAEYITDETAKLLANTYGMHSIDIARLVREDPTLAKPLIPGRPEIFAQIHWGVRNELAATVSDILMRRTQIFYRDLDQGLGCAEAVAEAMQSLIGWDEAQRALSVTAYQKEVQLSREWRDEL